MTPPNSPVPTPHATAAATTLDVHRYLFLIRSHAETERTTATKRMDVIDSRRDRAACSGRLRSLSHTPPNIGLPTCNAWRVTFRPIRPRMRCKQCKKSEWMRVSFESLSAAERQAIRLRPLAEVKMVRKVIWLDERADPVRVRSLTKRRRQKSLLQRKLRPNSTARSCHRWTQESCRNRS
jgi:hypothetical protein